jgi:serralysin
MASVTTYNLTGDRYVDGLLGDVKWATTSLTFSMPTSGAYYESDYGYGEPDDNFCVLNSAQQSAVNSTLTMYASITDLGFTEINETSTRNADLRFAMSDMPSTAWAYYPSTAAEGGDAWFNNSSGWYDDPALGNYAYSTFLHETGHGLGLEHAHEGNAMPVDRDSLEYTVMSYRSYIGASLNSGYTNETWGYPQSPMMYDIAAVQHLYGPNYSTNSGNTTYSWSPSTGEMFINGVGQGAPGANRIFLTVWDGGGVDTYDFSNYTTNLDVDLRPGEWTTTSSAQLAKLHWDGSEVAVGNIANALTFNGDPRSLIDNAKGGSGDDVVMGNSAANVLSGLNGNDRLFGMTGDDRLYGHGGDDNLSGGAGNNVLAGGPGNDALISGIGHDRLYGGDGDDFLRGGAGDDRLYGETGNDRLDGEAGDDRLDGGDGNDCLVGGDGNDVLVGGAGDDRLYGGPGDDRLFGNAGADLLVGGGGQDMFVFRLFNDSTPGEMDTIRDFASGVDTIDLRSIDANVYLAGDQAFDFIGGAAFGYTAGELSFRNEILSADINGDGIPDFQVYLAGVSLILDSDFLL